MQACVWNLHFPPWNPRRMSPRWLGLQAWIPEAPTAGPPQRSAGPQLPQPRHWGTFWLGPLGNPPLLPKRSQGICLGPSTGRASLKVSPERKCDRAEVLDKGNFWAGFVQKFPVKCFTSRLGKDWGTLGNLVNKGLDSKKSRSPPKPLLRAWDAASRQWVEGCVMRRWFYALPFCLDLRVVLSLHLALSMLFSSSRSQKKKKKKNRKYCKWLTSTTQPALQSAWVTVVTPSPNAVLFLPNFYANNLAQGQTHYYNTSTKVCTETSCSKGYIFFKEGIFSAPLHGFWRAEFGRLERRKEDGIFFSFHGSLTHI